MGVMGVKLHSTGSTSVCENQVPRELQWHYYYYHRHHQQLKNIIDNININILDNINIKNNINNINIFRICLSAQKETAKDRAYQYLVVRGARDST